MKKILFVGAEAMPFAATGGLGDVLGSLPRALCETGEAQVRVMLPLYRAVEEKWRAEMREVATFEVALAWRRQCCTVRCLEHAGVSYYFIDNAYYFDRDGLYGHYDDGERFAFFCMAALEALAHIDFLPDVLHAHDWQAALCAVYLETHFRKNPLYAGMQSVFTIHNIEYQGRFSAAILGDVFALGEEERGRVEFAGDINLMKGAIVSAARVSTVSPQYAKEICTPAFAHGLDGILRDNAHKLCGILNGIDTEAYNPLTDGEIPCRYSARSPWRKTINKQALQRELGLEERADVPILAVVSRLAQHKGLDLVAQSAQALLSRDVQLVILGCGEARLEHFFRELERNYPHRCVAYIGYDRALARRIYAAADVFLMPSQSEPCGLSQMIAARYGAIPVVHAVGGLFDSIQHFSCEKQKIVGNGVPFSEYSAAAMLQAVEQALTLLKNGDTCTRYIAKMMRHDFSWRRSALGYLELYRQL